jgi:hypothetical protein
VRKDHGRWQVAGDCDDVAASDTNYFVPLRATMT